jgi:putative FmdB family regulatory protein
VTLSDTLGSPSKGDVQRRPSVLFRPVSSLDPGLPDNHNSFSIPTYEYVCEKCGHHFDKFQSMTAKPLTLCPRELCAEKDWGRGKVKRAISGGAGLIFKGSGFYITDYRSDKYKEAAKKESSSATPSSPKGGADNKPASKGPESKPAKTAAT